MNKRREDRKIGVAVGHEGDKVTSAKKTFHKLAVSLKKWQI